MSLSLSEWIQIVSMPIALPRLQGCSSSSQTPRAVCFQATLFFTPSPLHLWADGFTPKPYGFATQYLSEREPLKKKSSNNYHRFYSCKQETTAVLFLKKKTNQKTNYRFCFPQSDLSLLPPLSACTEQKTLPAFPLYNFLLVATWQSATSLVRKAPDFKNQKCPSCAAGRLPEPIPNPLPGASPRKQTAP